MSVYDLVLTMLHAFVVLVSSSVVCTVYPYACASAMFIDCWMLCGFKRVSAFEFATIYTFRLYFLGCVPYVVCVCGSVTRFWVYLVCRFRAMYGVCFHFGSISIVALG